MVDSSSGGYCCSSGSWFIYVINKVEEYIKVWFAAFIDKRSKKLLLLSSS